MSDYLTRDDITFDIDYDCDMLKKYEKLFLDYCKDHIPGSMNRYSSVYYQSLIASEYFAKCMLEDSNDIAKAYEVGFSVMFNSEELN